MERPTTTADCLDSIANNFHLLAEGYGVIARALDIDELPLPEVEVTDLRLIAQWLREHPDVDEQMHGLITLDDFA